MKRLRILLMVCEEFGAVWIERRRRSKKLNGSGRLVKLEPSFRRNLRRQFGGSRDAHLSPIRQL